MRFGHALLLSSVIKHGLPKLVECGGGGEGGEGGDEGKGDDGVMYDVVDQVIAAVQVRL